MPDQPNDDSTIEAEAAALVEKISTALRLVTEDAPMHTHTSWEVCEMLDELETGDLTPAEMMVLAIVLAGANARRLARPPSLRLISEVREGLRGA